MKTQKFLTNFLAFIIVLLAISACSQQTDKAKLRHVVLFKFKEGTAPEDVKKVEAAFAALPAKISAIRDFEWGINNSPENLNKGFTHCFLLTFDSEEDRKIYLPHPDHKNFGNEIGQYLQDVVVVDYWTPQE